MNTTIPNTGTLPAPPAAIGPRELLETQIEAQEHLIRAYEQARDASYVPGYECWDASNDEELNEALVELQRLQWQLGQLLEAQPELKTTNELADDLIVAKRTLRFCREHAPYKLNWAQQAVKDAERRLATACQQSTAAQLVVTQ